MHFLDQLAAFVSSSSPRNGCGGMALPSSDSGGDSEDAAEAGGMLLSDGGSDVAAGDSALCIPAGSSDGGLSLPASESDDLGGHSGLGGADGPSSGRARRKRRRPSFPSCGQRVDNIVGPISIGTLPLVDSSVNICLRHSPMSGLQISPRWARLCDTDHVVRVYGTLRRISATHCCSGALTDRNKHELPQCVYFDDEFRADWAARRFRALPQRMAVTPRFAEWLMGLPPGWTAPGPLDALARSSHFAFKHKLLRHPARLATVSLFSGCGALDLALLPWCAPVAYCDICPVAAVVLRARMSDGSLPRGPVFGDARLLTRKTFAGQLPGFQLPDKSGRPMRDGAGQPGVFAGCLNQAGVGDLAAGSLGLVFGFPCTNTSKAGLREGLKGSASCLAFEALRIAEELSANWMFIENVDGICSGGSLQELVGEIGRRGFQCRWLVLGADSGGSPQRRKRLFLLAWRWAFQPCFLLPPQKLRNFTEVERGLNFNGGRPQPPADWMSDMTEYPQAKPRLELLGNCVVPQQAMVAASILAHGPE